MQFINFLCPLISQNTKRTPSALKHVKTTTRGRCDRTCEYIYNIRIPITCSKRNVPPFKTQNKNSKIRPLGRVVIMHSYTASTFLNFLLPPPSQNANLLPLITQHKDLKTTTRWRYYPTLLT